VAIWERERRHQGPDQEEEPLLRRGPSPGKRSLTHRFIGADWNDSAGEAPADVGMAPASHVRAQVEATTGGDLSAARVHTGAESQAEASALRARAFTVGSDIHFAAGQYQPGTPAGDALIAHELVHTLQQGGGEPTAQLKASDVSQEGDAAEVEADRIAHAAVSGAATRMAPVARAAPIARTPETLSGNPAELTDASGTATTSHRAVTLGDSVNPPAAATAAGAETRTANVRPIATETSPLHLEPPSTPAATSVFEEQAAPSSPPPTGFSSVTGFSGTMAAPMVEQVATNNLYIGGGPTADDVQQGGIGDCAFQSLLMSLVARDPGKITSMMVPDGRGGATVTFWRAEAHSPSLWERVFGGAPARDWIQVAVTVNDQLAVNVSDNRVHGAQIRCAPAPRAVDYWAKVVATNLELHRKDFFDLGRWAPILEKAYARFAQAHGNYGGAAAGNTIAPSGYTAINGAIQDSIMPVFYGPLTADPAHAPTYNPTTFTPGTSTIVADNAAAMEQLILLQGRGTGAAAGDRDAPIVTAAAQGDAMIGRLQALIPPAQADPDYIANVDVTRKGLVTAVATSITAWNALPPDPAAPAAQPKAVARVAIGTACAQAVRPGVDESAGEQQILNDYFRAWGATIQFPQGDSTVPAPSVAGMGSMNHNLRLFNHPQVEIHLDGHSSSEGTDEVNQRLSQERVDNVETAITSPGAIAPHTITKTAHGENGATGDAAWRKVQFTFTPTGHHTNSLLDTARSRPVQDMANMMLDLRNLGTDSSPGQRGIYADHGYSVVAVNIVSTTGVAVPLSSVPASSRAALYPLVDPNVSTVTLRNPHHGNEPDRLDSRTPNRAGDGAPSGPSADGTFTISLYDFFRSFTSVQSGVFPRT
jgi:outer membrane protein OmpA-like peptidoglycan-associated protein